MARRMPQAGWRWFARIWLPVQAAVLLAYLPFVVVMVQLTRGDLGSGLDWVPSPTAQTVWSTLQAVFLMRRSSLIAFRVFPGAADLFGLPWLGLCVLLLAAFGVVRGRGSPRVRVLLLAVLALPVGVALCSLRSSLWMPRYLLWSSPMLFLLAGVGVAFLPRRPALLVIALAAGVGLVNLLPYYGDETKPLWNQAAFLLRDSWNPSDLLLTDDPATIAMMNVALDPRSAIPGFVPSDGFTADDWTNDPAAALRAHRNGRRVWLLHGRVGQNDSDRLETLLHAAGGLGTPSDRRTIGLDIVLLRFDPAGHADEADSAPP